MITRNITPNLSKIVVPLQGENSHQPKYRTDIDGLRAIAVLSVVGFHAFPRWFQGGFVGVDVFFVISGFLISGIIFRSIVRGEFSYREFYGRRIRRIFPSLIVVLLCCLLYGYEVLFSTEFSRMAGHMAAAVAFVANILFWREAGYFDTDAALKPMLHLWSLGVEEQYYILWPLLLSAIMLKMRRFYLVIIALFIASFWANLALTWREPTAAFFLPATRFWELMLGSVLAYLATMRPPTPALFVQLVERWSTSTIRDMLSFVGLGMIATSALLLNTMIAFPGWWALMPTVGAALIIMVGPNAWVNRHLLSWSGAVFFGLISYPLYLWHWPILAFLHISLGGDLSRPIRIAAVLTSVALAWLTYRFIERPIRLGSHGGAKIVSLVGTLAAIGICAFVVSYSPKPTDSRDNYVAFFDNHRPDYHYGHTHNLFALGREECNFLDIVANSVRDQIADNCTMPETGTSVLLWGDSHIQHLASGLRTTLPADISLLQVATSGCIPNLEETKSNHTSNHTLACARSNSFARQTIARVRPDIVVLAQRSGHLDTDWARLSAGIRALGARQVILVGPVPKWNRDLYMIVARKYWPNPPEWIGEGLIEEDRVVDRELKRRYEASSDLIYVSIIAQMCRSDSCLAFVGPDKYEDIVTHDYGHFTTAASHYVAERTVTPAVRALVATLASSQAFPYSPH